MAADHHSETEDDLATGVRQALAAAAIGRDVTFVGLSEAGGIGEISVTGETATVTVTLPIPAPDVRARMRAEIR